LSVLTEDGVLSEKPAPERLSSGIDAAWLNLRFRKPLIAYFRRRLGDPAEAEDLTQQVFIRLVDGDLGNVIHIERYIFAIAANLLRDTYRKEARQGDQVFLSIDDDLVGSIAHEVREERTPERILLGKERLDDVLASLSELGEKTRAIFILFRLENMKQQEIADLLGIGRSTVEKHVIKATLHLARKYGLS
jgi:RNA polymerase sigma-70 factor (ECF subfamily)